MVLGPSPPPAPQQTTGDVTRGLKNQTLHRAWLLRTSLPSSRQRDRLSRLPHSYSGEVEILYTSEERLCYSGRDQGSRRVAGGLGLLGSVHTAAVPPALGTGLNEGSAWLLVGLGEGRWGEEVPGREEARPSHPRSHTTSCPLSAVPPLPHTSPALKPGISITESGPRFHPKPWLRTMT